MDPVCTEGGVSVSDRKGFLYRWQMRLYLWSSAETLSLSLTLPLSPESAAWSWWLSSIRERGIRWPLKTQFCVSVLVRICVCASRFHRNTIWFSPKIPHQWNRTFEQFSLNSTCAFCVCMFLTSLYFRDQFLKNIQAKLRDVLQRENDSNKH